MSRERMDVLSVIGACAAVLRMSYGHNADAQKLAEARDAVRELIEAAKEMEAQISGVGDLYVGGEAPASEWDDWQDATGRLRLALSALTHPSEAPDEAKGRGGES